MTNVERERKDPSPEYVPWSKRESRFGNDHEYLAGLTPNDWYDLYLDPGRCFALVSGAMLEEEYARYNFGEDPRPETKILFVIAPNLRDALNLDGSRARMKESRWAKASEHDELIAVLSQFIDHYPGTPSERVYSEVADTFWNLIHLTVTDDKSRDLYLQLIDQLAGSLDLSRGQVGLMTLVKYQTRMYELRGVNNHAIEDAQIARLMVGAWARDDEEAKLPGLDERKASLLFDVAQRVMRPKLLARLSQLMADKAYLELLAQASCGESGLNG